MYGNVEEWMADCYNSNFKNAPTNGMIWNEGSCQFGVVRGGSWAKPSKFLRSKHRDQVSKEAKDDTLGFNDYNRFLFRTTTRHRILFAIK
jgi:formylglycine-generating enzyme required for sulfatase activity